MPKNFWEEEKSFLVFQKPPCFFKTSSSDVNFEATENSGGGRTCPGIRNKYPLFERTTSHSW